MAKPGEIAAIARDVEREAADDFLKRDFSAIGRRGTHDLTREAA